MSVGIPHVYSDPYDDSGGVPDLAAGANSMYSGGIGDHDLTIGGCGVTK